MTSEPGWMQIPPGWTNPTDEDLHRAKEATLLALSGDSERPVVPRLAGYYDRSGDFAGASFVTLSPVDPWDVTAADLHAVSLLSVQVSPGATRRLLHPAEPRSAVLDALAAIPTDADLLTSGPDTLVAMEHLYLTVKGYLSGASVRSPNAWVTASKLCARKRPALFPVRDEWVCTFLGLLGDGRRGNYRRDWLTFRHLIGDKDVMVAVDAAFDEVTSSAGRDVELDSIRLRLLDAALWTWASGKP